MSGLFIVPYFCHLGYEKYGFNVQPIPLSLHHKIEGKTLLHVSMQL